MNRFGFPQAFWLLVLPFIIYYFFPRIKGLHGNALRVPFIKDLEYIKNKTPYSVMPIISSKILTSLKFLYLFAIWGLLVLACARPQYIGEPHRLKSQNRDIMLVIDISTSMLERDLPTARGRVERLAAVKYVVNQFIEDRKSDKIGLILFGTRAYMQSPLTFDRKSVQDILYNADAGMAGNSTSIGDALGLALKNLKEDTNNKIIILLTDGESNDGFLSIAQAINLAENEGIKIYTIGVGSDKSFLNSLFSVQNHELDENSLKEIAEKTKGDYFRAKDVHSLSQIYSRIDKLEPQDSDAGIVQEKKDLFYVPLFIALILVSIVLFIPRRFLK